MKRRYYIRIPCTQFFVRAPRWFYNRWRWAGIVEIYKAQDK